MHTRLPLRRLPTRLLLDRPTLAGPRDRHGATGLAPTVTLAYPAAMPGAPYYAEALSPLPGRCFRLVAHHHANGAREPTPRTVALDPSALLEVLDALKAADVDDRIRQAAR